MSQPASNKPPVEVLALAAAVNGVPLDWKVMPEKTVIVMVDGRKMTFERDSVKLSAVAPKENAPADEVKPVKEKKVKHAKAKNVTHVP